MKVHLEADYKSYTTFSPTYSFGGQLISVGVLTHFMHTSANVAIPQDLLLPQLNQTQRITLLQTQLNIIEKHADFFLRHDVKVALKADEILAVAILENEFVTRRLAALKWIEIEINENFPDLKQGKENPCLSALSQIVDLSLENYGAGKSPSKAIYDNLFTSIKLDKGFVQHNIKRLSFKPFISALLEHIRPLCERVIVQGIEDPSLFKKVSHFDFHGIQSSLFAPVSEETLYSLIAPPAELSGLRPLITPC
ncbi:EAL domain-containing protein [Erwinia mallotivora]|uniref:EAL domain-containing protein n=1 Tax=Erwinia mallotivora TaxID=69222 RepID=UPI0035EEC3FB